MSFDESRLQELQTALRTKMADNKAIADSFKIEDGTVIVNTDQKSAFDKNMRDIKEIKSLIEGLEGMRDVESWGSEASSDSVAVKAAAAGASNFDARRPMTIGEMFLASEEFKSLQGGRNGANMPSPFVLSKSDITSYSVKDVYSALPSGTPSSFGRIDRDPIVTQPTRTRRFRDLFPVRSTTAALTAEVPGVVKPSIRKYSITAAVVERTGKRSRTRRVLPDARLHDPRHLGCQRCFVGCGAQLGQLGLPDQATVVLPVHRTTGSSSHPRPLGSRSPERSR